MEYFDLAGLELVLLEESWVLDVAPSESQIAFRIEAVLLPGHPAFTGPKPGQQYCYRSGWLIVASSEAVSVALSGSRPAVDASGTTDLGNIDVFAEISSDLWILEGDWGQATVHWPRADLVLD